MSRLECGCPGEYPDWKNGQDVDLGAWLVHEMGTPMFIHMPIGFEAYLHKQHQDIERLGLTPRWPGFVLAKSAMFRGAIICPLADEQSPARHVHRLTNPFRARVALVHGDVGQIRGAISSMQSALLDEGLLPKSLYLAYLTCPRCEDERGGKKIMLLRHWLASDKLKKRLKQR